MSVLEFEQKLRDLMRRSPFQPFIVKVNDGRSIYVDQPSIAFGGGRAGFIGPDDSVEFFDCEEVVSFDLANEELAK